MPHLPIDSIRGNPRFPRLSLGVRHAAPWSHILLIVVVLLGCSHGPIATETRESHQPNTTNPPSPVPIKSSIAVVPDEPAVIAVTVPAGFDMTQPITVRLGEMDIPASLYRITVQPNATPSWLGPTGTWSAVPAASADAQSPGYWALFVHLPDATETYSLEIGSRRVRLDWLPPQSSLRRLSDDPSHDLAWRSPVPASRRNAPRLLELIEPIRHDPHQRWRVTLLENGLTPPLKPIGVQGGLIQRTDVIPAPDPSAGFNDPVLEALAEQIEARWRTGIARLWMIDPVLATRLRQRLVAVADFGEGQVAPAWPGAEARLDLLLADLLDPTLPPGKRIDRVGGWVDRLPGAASWVVSDHNGRDPILGLPVCVVGAANLRDTTTLAWADGDVADRTPEPVELPASDVLRLSVTMPSRLSESGRPAPGSLTVHAGSYRAEHTVVSSPLPATPPGVRLTPFTEDLTLATWRDEAPVVADPNWATAGLFYKTPSRDDPDALIWSIYIECRVAPGLAWSDRPPETIRIWFGPDTRSLSTLQLSTTDGIERTTATGTPPPSPPSPPEPLDRAWVILEPGRWICQTPVPADVIGEDGTVLVGIERIDGRGVRTSWPRPMLPWQIEPGRVAIDTGRWEGE